MTARNRIGHCAHVSCRRLDDLGAASNDLASPHARERHHRRHEDEHDRVVDLAEAEGEAEAGHQRERQKDRDGARVQAEQKEGCQHRGDDLETLEHGVGRKRPNSMIGPGGGSNASIYDYLRLLFEKLGVEYCETCNLPMQRLGYQEIFESIRARHAGGTILISFRRSLPSSNDATAEILAEQLRSGYIRVVLDGEIAMTEELIKGGKAKGKEIAFVMDRVRLPSDTDESLQTRVTETLRNAMALGNGEATVFAESGKRYTLVDDFTTKSRCPKCRKVSVPKSAISFSFNSPLGARESAKVSGTRSKWTRSSSSRTRIFRFAQGAVDPFAKPSWANGRKSY